MDTTVAAGQAPLSLFGVSASTPTCQASQEAAPGVSHPVSQQAGILPAFEDWYQGYPRKRCKPDALNAYRAAVRKGHTPAVLLAARDALVLEAREAQFWPYPATFLRRHLGDYLISGESVPRSRSGDESQAGQRYGSASAPSEPFPYHSLYQDDSRLTGTDPIPVSCAAQLTERDLAAGAEFFHTRRNGR